MVSEGLLLELKQLFIEEFKIELSKEEARDLADFLLSYFSLLLGIGEGCEQ